MADNYLFLDTNIFIHCKSAKEIAWKNYVNGSYQLVVAPIVIDELDKHRRSQTKRIANRAKATAKLFEQVMEHNDREFVLLTSRPKPEAFSDHGLDRAEQDDCLIASLIEFSSKNPDTKTILVTDDIGPRLKANNLGIKTLKLPDHEHLPEEHDEMEVKLKKLIRENNELKNQVPKVDVFFKDKTKHTNFNDFHGTVTFEQYREKQMRELKSKYPYHRIPFKMPTPREVIFNNTLMESIAQNDSNRYNRELNEFFEEYQDTYLPKLYEWMINGLLSVELSLEIHNQGNIPAHDIDLCLSFPKGIIVQQASYFNRFPTPPIAPEKPLPLNELLIKAKNLENEIAKTTKPPLLTPEPPIAIRNADGYQVDLKCTYLKHHQSFAFSKLAISFETLDDMKGFEFNYRLMIANDPKLNMGKLQVSFVKTVPFSKSINQITAELRNY